MYDVSKGIINSTLGSMGMGNVGGTIGGALGIGKKKKDYRWASGPTGGNKYYTDYLSASVAANPYAYMGGKVANKWQIWFSHLDWKKQKETQDREFETLKGATKTVNYNSAVSNMSNLSGELTTEEERARASLALNEEEEKLGKRIATFGSANLGGLR